MAEVSTVAPTTTLPATPNDASMQPRGLDDSATRLNALTSTPAPVSPTSSSSSSSLQHTRRSIRPRVSSPPASPEPARDTLGSLPAAKFEAGSNSRSTISTFSSTSNSPRPSSPRPALGRAVTEPSSPSSPTFESSDRRPARPSSFATHRPPPTTALASAPALTLRPRNRSPFARTHFRSRSGASPVLGSSLTAPSMARAHSSPVSDTFSTSASPSSVGYGATSPPLGSPWSPRPESPLTAARSGPHARRTSPLRRPFDETSFSGFDIDQTIAENAELDITPRPSVVSAHADMDSPSLSSMGTPLSPHSPYAHATFPRASRRRPSSPLHPLLPTTMSSTTRPASTNFSGSHCDEASALHISYSSPALRSFSASAASGTSMHTPSVSYGRSSSSSFSSNGSGSHARYNEAYPLSGGPYALSVASVSSVPSTPTSLRSRSPSISSLETIPDSPDAELEAARAAEADRDAIAQLKAAMERESSNVNGASNGNGNGGVRRGSFESHRGRGLVRSDYGSSGAGGANARERKRWSVCGAERRGDLDLETIWED